MNKVILFDGVCNLCNSAITFVIQRDKKDMFKYAALQSDIGKELAKKHHINLDNVDSIILVTDKKAYVKSTAALHIAKKDACMIPTPELKSKFLDNNNPT